MAYENAVREADYMKLENKNFHLASGIENRNMQTSINRGMG